MHTIIIIIDHWRMVIYEYNIDGELSLKTVTLYWESDSMSIICIIEAWRGKSEP